jgi:hypothetical protein
MEAMFVGQITEPLLPLTAPGGDVTADAHKLAQCKLENFERSLDISPDASLTFKARIDAVTAATEKTIMQILPSLTNMVSDVSSNAGLQQQRDALQNLETAVIRYRKLLSIAREARPILDPDDD